jgi:hypothetical protein
MTAPFACGRTSALIDYMEGFSESPTWIHTPTHVSLGVISDRWFSAPSIREDRTGLGRGRVWGGNAWRDCAS